MKWLKGTYLNEFYATSSCSIKTKNKAKTIPGKTNVTIGVNMGGKNDAVMIVNIYYLSFN